MAKVSIAKRAGGTSRTFRGGGILRGPNPASTPLGVLRASRGIVQRVVGEALYPGGPSGATQTITSKFEVGDRKITYREAHVYGAVIGEPWQRVMNLANMAYSARWGEPFFRISEPDDLPGDDLLVDDPPIDEDGANGDIAGCDTALGDTARDDAGAAPTGLEKENEMTMNANALPVDPANRNGAEPALPADMLIGRLKPVTGRDLEKAIAAFIWHRGEGKTNQAMKLCEEEVRDGLRGDGFSATLPQVRGAMVSLMTSNRLNVVRECPEFGTRVYKTTEQLRKFADVSKVVGDMLGALETPEAAMEVSYSAAGQRDGATIAQPVTVQSVIAQPVVQSPAPSPQSSAPPESLSHAGQQLAEPAYPFGLDSDAAIQDAQAALFEDQLLGLLARAGTTRDTEKRLKAVQGELSAALEANGLLEARALVMAEQFHAAAQKSVAAQAALDTKVGVDGRDVHAMRKAAYILEQLSEQMQNPMVAAFFGAINVKADDLGEAIAVSRKLAGH